MTRILFWFLNFFDGHFWTYWGEERNMKRGKDEKRRGKDQKSIKLYDIRQIGVPTNFVVEVEA